MKGAAGGLSKLGGGWWVGVGGCSVFVGESGLRGDDGWPGQDSPIPGLSLPLS